MAQIKYEVVDAASQRDPDPAQRIRDAIRDGGARGWELVQILPLFDVIQLVWRLPTREQRG